MVAPQRFDFCVSHDLDRASSSRISPTVFIGPARFAKSAASPSAFFWGTSYTFGGVRSFGDNLQWKQAYEELILRKVFEV